MDFKQLIEQIRRNDATYRDVKLEKILDPDYKVKSNNQSFIDEVRDHFSTIINRHQFITIDWFINLDDFNDLGSCNCKVHYEEEDDFLNFLKVLHSMYRSYEDFKPEVIINKHILDKLI